MSYTVKIYAIFYQRLSPPGVGSCMRCRGGAGSHASKFLDKWSSPLTKADTQPAPTRAPPAEAARGPAFGRQTYHTAVRGVLIFVVMLDHNDIIRNVRSVQDWFLPMTFHVAGFLMLPFLAPSRALSWRASVDRPIRYLVPFLFALLGYSAAFQLIVRKQWPSIDRAIDFVHAFVFADPWSLQVSTGFVMLWFLPTLFSVVLLVSLYDSVSARSRIALLAVTTAVHLFVGAASLSQKMSVPQGLLIALYVFPLGIAMQHVMPWLSARRRHVLIGIAAAGVLLACWSFELGTEVEVATLVLPTWRQPLWIIATDLSDLSGLVLLVISAPVLARIPGVLLLGKYSLLVYLFHPILYKPLLALMLPFCDSSLLASPSGEVLYWLGAAASVGCVAGLSLGCATICHSSRLFREMVTPRGVGDWWPVAFFNSQSHRAGDRQFRGDIPPKDPNP